ncbi:MAG: DUF1592 domain-containing protein [Gemmatimonadales bacterium]
MNKFAFATLSAALLFVACQSARTGRATRVLAAAPAMARSYAPDALSVEASNAIIKGTCMLCHNDQARMGNMTLASFDVARTDQNGEIAEKMIRKLRAGMMPPAGIPRPGGDTLTAFAVALETRMDRAAAAHPNPGRRTFQRLNRAEYESSIRDLLGLDVNAGDYLPLDTKSANFDNIADVQMPSATQMEGYLRAASHISRIAISDPDASPSSTTYRVAKTASQLDHVEGAPIGTRGGLSVVHNFPADGQYVFKLELHPGPTGFLYGMTSPGEQLEVSINGERVALLNIDRWMDESDPSGMRIETDSISVRAGPQRVSAAFIRKFEGSVDDLIKPVDHTLADTQIGSAYGVTTLPHLRDLAIIGPFAVTGVSDTPSRRKIFTCRPTAPDEARPCAESIVSRLASRAYRRPLNGEDLKGLMSFYEHGARDGGFEAGVRTALQAILASPHFVFRIEETPRHSRPGDVYRISDYDLAARLSFFLWDTPPDDELIELAKRGKLSDRATLNGQARRMLRDPRSEALATRFFAQWLRLQDLEKLHPDAQLYPYYDRTLAEAMRRETELLFSYLVREDRSILELLTADYTFINGRLARHYGIPGVTGAHFRRVNYPDDTRRGLLGHGSVLALTSHANRTSPVLRGKWVMEVLLGTPPPPPPPGVPTLEATKGTKAGRLLTTRERMEQHRSNPVCQSCHRFMDPIGLALDNFDVTGKWRIKENSMPLDTRGQLYDGTPLTSPGDLREALLARPDAVLRNFTANLMAYALGRRVEYYDMPAVRRIVSEARANDNRVSSYILGVVNTAAFQMSKVEAAVAASGGEGR